MEIEDLALTVAEFKGEVKAFRELFGQHTRQEADRFSDLAKTVNVMDEKIDRLLIREARLAGEFKGMRNAAIAAATAISTVIAAVSWAAPYFV